MTPSSAPDAATDRQTVGDILLARAYISQEQLDHAIASQQQSGKPLGQVLVEAGAITRLELASALAEQWSDTATWLGPPADAKGQRRGRITDEPFSDGREAGYAQQLQDAVVELARRVAAFEPTVTDLKLRVEAQESGGGELLLDRVEVLQDGVTALARRLDELTDGVERAFAAVERGSEETAGEIDTLTEKVGLAASESALEELRTAVAELTARPQADPGLATRLEELTARIEALAGTDALDAVRAAVAEIADRPAGDPDLTAQVEALAGQLTELEAAVAEISGRPQADPELATRLEELTARIEAVAGTDALDAVRAAVAEIADRPAADPELTGRIEALGGQLDELGAAVADIAARPQADPELAARVETLAGLLDELGPTVADLAGRPQADPELATRLEELTARIEALAGTDALDAVRAAVAEIADRPAADPELTGRIEELSARLEETAGTLAERLDGYVETGALNEVLAAIAELGARIDQVASSTLVDVDGAVQTLRTELESLSERAGALDPELDRRVDNVVGRLDALHARVEEIAAVPAPADHTGVLDELQGVVRELAERIDLIGAQPAGPDLAEALRAELEAKIEEVSGRTVGLAEETAGAVGAWVAERQTLEARIEALAAELAEARASTPAPAPAAPAPKAARAKAKAAEAVPEDTDSELEKLRMAVERINMHLGERERAIAELMRSRSEVKLEDLAARLAELEQAGGGGAKKSKADPAAGGDMSTDLRDLAARIEEAEKAAKTDRDKLLTQLERMASSIDWRFRRLESGEADAAA